MKLTKQDANIVLCHLPTMEAAEEKNRTETAAMIAKWRIDQLPKTVGELQKMLVIARSRGFYDGVRACIGRIVDLQDAQITVGEQT